MVADIFWGEKEKERCGSDPRGVVDVHIYNKPISFSA